MKVLPTPIQSDRWQFTAATCIRCGICNIFGPPQCDCWNCPECGADARKPVDPFSDCITCEKRIAEENRRAAHPFDTSPASPLALRLAESMKDDRRCD